MFVCALPSVMFVSGRGMKPESPAQEVLLLTITTHSARYLTHQPSLCYLLLLLLRSFMKYWFKQFSFNRLE